MIPAMWRNRAGGDQRPRRNMRTRRSSFLQAAPSVIDLGWRVATHSISPPCRCACAATAGRRSGNALSSTHFAASDPSPAPPATSASAARAPIVFAAAPARPGLSRHGTRRSRPGPGSPAPAATSARWSASSNRSSIAAARSGSAGASMPARSTPSSARPSPPARPKRRGARRSAASGKNLQRSNLVNFRRAARRQAAKLSSGIE
jgi:hypothetical protein